MLPGLGVAIAHQMAAAEQVAAEKKKAKVAKIVNELTSHSSEAA